MATILSESIYLGDWLKGEIELPQKLSRDQITLDNSGGSSPLTLITGTILGKITTSGRFVQLAPAATDGSQTVAGILGATVIVPTGGTLSSWAITRDATVSDINITYPAGITNNQKTAAISQMAALQIIVRRTA